MDAAAVCAMLTARGYVSRAELPELNDPEVFEDVNHRLGQCGMELVDSGFTDFYAVRPTERSRFQITNQVASSRLTDPQAGLLLILWSKLMMPKLAQVEKDPRVSFENVWEEFGEQYGTLTNLQTAFGRLETLGFIEKIDGQYRAAAMMDIALDSKQLHPYILKSTVLQEVATRVQGMIDSRHHNLHEALRHFFQSIPEEELSPREVASRLNLSPDQVKEVMHDLYTSGFLLHNKRTGKASRYFWRKT